MTRMPTADERVFMNQALDVGCILCLRSGIHNMATDLHYMDGDVKAGCYYHILPLCVHHQRAIDSRFLHVNEPHIEYNLFQYCLEVINEKDR